MEASDVEAGPSRALAMDFSSSLARWREIQLPAVQTDLESLLPSMMDSQKDALLSRKKLAEQTREFKKVAADGQPEAIKPLLKAYQTEIDSLTKRAKAAETAVLSVRDRLQGATDPYPILELVVEQTALVGDVEQLRAQMKRLQSTNASLEAQLASMPSLEAERVRLSKRVAQLESSTNELRKNVEVELAAKWDERIQNHKLRETNAVKSLEAVQGQLKELRVNYSRVTERLLHHGEEIEREQANGKTEELEMIGEELSRSNERAAAMEKRNEQLRQQIEQLRSGSGDDLRLVEMERRALDAEEQNRRLSKLLEDEAMREREGDEQREARVREANRLLQEKEGECELLRKKVKGMADYDEVKRELEIFKFVEFAAESDRHIGGEEGETEQELQRSAGAKPLEALLIEKNRKLQDDMTSLRVSSNEANSALQQASADLEQARGEATRLKQLSDRLENDLLNVNPARVSSAPSQSLSAEETLAEMEKLGNPNGALDEARKKAVTDALSTREATPSPFPAERATGSNTPNTHSASNILPIITSQRDRFRARNAELEEELRRQVSTITELRTEIKTLQADNLGLYEKMRYLQSYQQSAGSTSSRSAMRSFNVPIAARNDFGANTAYPPSNTGEDKYRERYEASMNPFEAFRGQEQSRALSNLNPLERLLHMLTRLVLGHRRMRIFFIVYAVCLHLLVFAMLFEVEFATGSAPRALQGVTPAREAM